MCRGTLSYYMIQNLVTILFLSGEPLSLSVIAKMLEVKVKDKKSSGIKTMGVSFNSSFQPNIMFSAF